VHFQGKPGQVNQPLAFGGERGFLLMTTVYKNYAWTN